MFQGNGFSKKLKKAPYRHISRILTAVVETVTHATDFLWNTSWLPLTTFVISVARALHG